MSIASSPMVPTSHYHVWTTEDLCELIADLNRRGFIDWSWSCPRRSLPDPAALGVCES